MELQATPDQYMEAVIPDGGVTVSDIGVPGATETEQAPELQFNPEGEEVTVPPQLPEVATFRVNAEAGVTET
jgi:hypothetical protein